MGLEPTTSSLGSCHFPTSGPVTPDAYNESKAPPSPEQRPVEAVPTVPPRYPSGQAGQDALRLGRLRLRGRLARLRRGHAGQGRRGATSVQLVLVATLCCVLAIAFAGLDAADRANRRRVETARAAELAACRAHDDSVRARTQGGPLCGL